MDTLYANYTVSVTELKRNFANILEKADGEPIAVLNHNKPEAYLVPAKHYEQLMKIIELQEDIYDSQLIEERKDGPFIEVNLNEL